MATGYFDVNATSPVDPRVAEEMERVIRDFPGNPGSAHRTGRDARRVLEDARERIAAMIGAGPREIVFTSGGTEADNLALRGMARPDGGKHLVISAVEHPAVLETAKALEVGGFRTTRVRVDDEGRVDPAVFAESLTADTFLASVMLANNETGTLEPVARMAALARRRAIPFHTDAVQAVGKVPVDVRELEVDLLSAGAHKFGGPRGIGFLYVRTGTPLAPILTGGGQERGRRSGTVPVYLAAGFARALELALAELSDRTRRVSELRDRLAAGILDLVPDTCRVSPASGVLPNTLNVTIRGVSGEALLMALDQEGFCIATGSACASGSALPSHVLTAMGLPVRDVTSSIRLSLGPENRIEEVEHFLDVLPKTVERLRTVAGTDPGGSNE